MRIALMMLLIVCICIFSNPSYAEEWTPIGTITGDQYQYEVSMRTSADGQQVLQVKRENDFVLKIYNYIDHPNYGAVAFWDESSGLCWSCTIDPSMIGQLENWSGTPFEPHLDRTQNLIMILANDNNIPTEFLNEMESYLAGRFSGVGHESFRNDEDEGSYTELNCSWYTGICNEIYTVLTIGQYPHSGYQDEIEAVEIFYYLDENSIKVEPGIGGLEAGIALTKKVSEMYISPNWSWYAILRTVQ